MSEAVANRLPFPDDVDHPPPKKIRLSLEEDDSACASLLSQSLTTIPSDPLSPEPAPQTNNNADDEFDPVQAILEVSRTFQEDDKELPQDSSPFEDSATKTNKEKDEAKKSDKRKTSVEDPVSDSEEDLPSDSEVTNTKKSERRATKKSNGLGKKKNKSSSMRRNIKDILTHDQLDDLTIAARKEEEERRERMNLKLKLLQEQQMQLINETLNDAPSFENYSDPNQQHRLSEDLLLKRLMRKKHITVDEDGFPKQKQNEDDCILLSSDEESDSRPLATSLSAHLSQLPPNFKSRYPMGYPSHIHNGPTGDVAEARVPLNHLSSDEVIALSSGDEDDDSGVPLKNSRLYDGATNTIGGRGAKKAEDEDSDDDDCVIISPGPEEDSEVDDKDECHQDLLNVPDQLGRILVNVGHPEEDPDLFLPPQIAKIVKPHQIGGIRFLYDNVVESKDRYNKSSGFGCILAHAMGLGKTLQTVSFCDVFLRTSGKTVLIIVPINTIQNWVNEFNKYLPSKDASNGNEHGNKRKIIKTKSAQKFDSQLDASLLENNSNPNSHDSTQNFATDANHDSDSNVEGPSEATPSTTSEEPTVIYRTFEVSLLNETVKSLQARENAIQTWASKGGVLLIGYEMYRMLALKRLKKSSRKIMNLDHDERIAEAESLENMYQCLVNPGPDCVICDEGHRIKNSGAGISQALKAIKTKRRVVLTGYPLQNNLMEYWCMVDFVRPNYLGNKAEFSNMFERPIQNGQCADSTFEDKRLMKHRSHVLHSLLEGFVQRRSHVVLKNALPHKEEWVFLVKLTPIQLAIYREFIRYLREDLDKDNTSANPIKAFAVCCKIWNHPDVLWNVVKKNLDLEMDLDIDELKSTPRLKANKQKRGTGRPRGRPPLNGIGIPMPRPSHQGERGIIDLLDDDDDYRLNAPTESSVSATSSGISLEWAKPLFENYVPEILENGVKFELLFLLIKETVAVGDKLLVFSQSLLTLDLIEVFLKQRLNWTKSCDYVRLDGSTAGLERERLIDQFNKSTTLKLFIISTRAGSLGINLVGANRACVFDSSWNPCHDSQAVCRIYRYGQTKPCHIYRFVADCTLEKRIYDRQLNKKGMADRIVDEMNPNTPFKSKDVTSFLVLNHELIDKLPYMKCDLSPEKYSDPVLQNILHEFGGHITQEPFEHESLLIDQKQQKLSRSEKRIALRNYQKDKQQAANTPNYQRPSYAQYYSSIGSASSYSASHSASSYNAHSQHHHHHHHNMSSRNSEEYGTSASSRTSNNLLSSDSFERHIMALKTRGISVFTVQVTHETILNDPNGSRTIFLNAGERVYLLVSQKGTYLRLKDKLLKVPFVGTDVNQEQAEKYVLSVLQSQSKGRNSMSDSPAYPVEQKLPPSNSFMFQKSLNHLQISNSRSNSGGDVMMGDGTNWENGTTENHHDQTSQQSSSFSHNSRELLHHLTNYSSSSNVHEDRYSPFGYGSHSHQHHVQPSHSESNLQSLSRLTETFCTSDPFPYAKPQPPSESSRWCSPQSSASRSEPLPSGPAGELEVIKLNHSQSSNSSTSSNSRTNSPYNKTNWNSNLNDISGSGNTAWKNNNQDPSYYTDFTITAINCASPSRSRPGTSQFPEGNSIWDSNNSRSNIDSRSPTASDLLRQKYGPSSTFTGTNSFESASADNLCNDTLLPLPNLPNINPTNQFAFGDVSLINKMMMSAQNNLGVNSNSNTNKDDINNETLRKLLIGSGSANNERNGIATSSTNSDLNFCNTFNQSHSTSESQF